MSNRNPNDLYQAIVSGPPVFSAHRIIISDIFNQVLRSLTPSLLQSFVPNQQKLMEDYCSAVDSHPLLGNDVADLVLETFRLFYGCLAYELHGARKRFEEQVLNEYANRLTVGYYVNEDSILTLMLDMLPNEVMDDEETQYAYRSMRMTFESKLNLLH